ncbi:uncharacterized protein LOC133779537 [Humulus lupulus]|uniref:uncharacterized protein LOC133779537 n=1 Tax=Humulus lupulus TaxID=3486 RepID=UPI002B402824|nr:uncharacterized protein LOC133779537 [Humulus lupulus]
MYCFGACYFIKWIGLDKAKIDLIHSLPPPSSVKEIRSFLGHAGLYRQFIKDFSKIASPLCNLLQKDVAFEFNDKCLFAFNKLKESLTSTPIIHPPNWELPFEIMCDNSDYAVGAILGQRVDKRGTENLVAEHLSRLIRDEDNLQLNENFPDEQLLALKEVISWFANIVNYLATKELPGDLTQAQKNKIKHGAKFYILDKPYLWKHCADQVIRRCVPDLNFNLSLLSHILMLVEACDHCQRVGNITARDQMLQTPILIIEIFNVWGIDFMGPFPLSFVFECILLAVDYVSKWMEAKATKMDNSKTVVEFIR